MKQFIIQISAAFLIMSTLSACGAISDTKNTTQINPEKPSISTTIDTTKETDEEQPFFKPLFASFHMGSAQLNTKKPNTLQFPVITKKVENVYVKAYRVNQEHFRILHGQQPKMVESEGKLDTSILSATEKKPFFEGSLAITETDPLLSIPRWATISESDTIVKESRMKGYIEIPLEKAATVWTDEGYYYFEFESPEKFEITGEKTYLNALLEVVETQGSYEE